MAADHGIPEAHPLPAEAGKPLPEDVICGPGERLQGDALRGSSHALREDLLRIQNRFRKLPVIDDRTAEEILGYDENGLPS